jgi:RecG-like helicase
MPSQRGRVGLGTVDSVCVQLCIPPLSNMGKAGFLEA